MDSTGVTVVATVPNSQVQLYTNGLDLTFYYNFKDLPIGQYRIRLNNGVATMTTGATVNINVVSNLTDLESCFNDFYAESNRPKILEIDTRNSSNAAILRGYFSSLK